MLPENTFKWADALNWKFIGNLGTNLKSFETVSFIEKSKNLKPYLKISLIIVTWWKTVSATKY